jgi:nicotinamide-nucleotide amidase
VESLKSVADSLLRAALAALSVTLFLQAGEPVPAPAAPPTPDYFIVVTGGELLEGAYPDGHTHFITRTLRPLGPRCVGSLSADDIRAEMLEALHFATNHANLVFVTGGLGPTPNDITRETLSEFSGLPLRESEAAVAELEKRLKQPRDQLRANLRRQCLVPERGGFLRNANGTAAGLIFDLGGKTVVALPGPPRELQPMVRDELVPWLQSHFGVRPRGASLTMRFVGAGQSQIDQILKDKVTLPPDVIITSLFEGSRVDFTFHLPGHSDAEAARLKQLGAAARQHLSEWFYADDGSSLEEVVLRRLKARGQRLALAEVASGGSLAAALNGAAGADAVVNGAFAAPTEARLAELLQARAWRIDDPAEARVKALAEAASAHAGADWAVVVGESRVEAGSHQLLVALKARDRCETRALSFRDLGDVSRASLVTQVLDFMRRTPDPP